MEALVIRALFVVATVAGVLVQLDLGMHLIAAAEAGILMAFAYLDAEGCRGKW